jgi:hypothetical protein
VILEHCQPHKIATLESLPLAEGDTDRWGNKKNTRYQNKTGLFQHRIRHTKPTPGSVSTHREGAKSTPRARITMRPKLGRSCWYNFMTGKSPRKTVIE